MQPEANRPLPTVIGLLVCEQAIFERRTDNLSLINCFTQKNIGVFPSPPQRFVLVAFLTGGVGDVPLEVVLRRLDTLDEVTRYRVVVQFVDRVREMRFVLRITNCSFPVAGGYEFSLMVSGHTLEQHRFQIT